MNDPSSVPERTTNTPQRGDSVAGSPDSTSRPAPAAPPRGDAVPQRVGRYEIRERLGAGAFGSVYRAFDPELKRDVAIKVPNKDALTPELLARIRTEALAAAAIHHPNVCPIYDVGADDDGVPLLVMRYVVGGTLDGKVKARKEPYAARYAAAVVRKIALGVAAAHARGVLHRDLKPANVLWDEEARDVLVTDFGLARVGALAQLSRTGDILGTPAYMSPEQGRGRQDEIGPLADVYSLGVILYRLTTGTVPFQGSVMEVLAQAQFDLPRPPSVVRPGLDPRVDALCAKAMEKKPEDRYPSARAFADALADYMRVSESGDAEESSHSVHGQQAPNASEPARPPGEGSASSSRSSKSKSETTSDLPPRPSERSSQARKATTPRQESAGESSAQRTASQSGTVRQWTPPTPPPQPAPRPPQAAPYRPPQDDYVRSSPRKPRGSNTAIVLSSVFGGLLLLCGGCFYQFMKLIEPTIPSAPSLAATSGDGQVSLSWGYVFRASKYTVYRGDKSGALKVLQADLTGTQFTDSNVANGKTYYYAVSATNSKGEGPKSAEATATPKVDPIPVTSIGNGSTQTSPPPPADGTLRVNWVSLDVGFSQLELFIDGQLNPRNPAIFGSLNTKVELDYELKSGKHTLEMKRNGILLIEKQVNVKPKSQGITPHTMEFHQTGMIEVKSRNPVAPGVVAWVWIDGQRVTQLTVGARSTTVQAVVGTRIAEIRVTEPAEFARTTRMTFEVLPGMRHEFQIPFN